MWNFLNSFLASWDHFQNIDIFLTRIFRLCDDVRKWYVRKASDDQGGDGSDVRTSDEQLEVVGGRQTRENIAL